MTLEQELLLSYYNEVAEIDAEHGVTLVQDSRSKIFYVKKQLLVYNPDIFHYLKDHPIRHTPRIRELVEDRKVLTVIEEYIPGHTLEQLLAQQGRFSREQAVGIVIALCRILEDFHRCTPPIVNRDIKPSNIILTPDGAVKLLDVNAAKWDTGTGIQDTVLLGTQGYAAPEQYGFGTSSVQTDVYALGILLQELLTGSSAPGVSLPGALGRVIRRCTQLSPRKRFRSVGELRGTLELLSFGTANGAPRNWRRFLPPGFRSGDSVACFFSLVAYGLMGNACLTLSVEGSPSVILLNRIAIICITLGILFFSGNYLNVQRHFPLSRSRNPLVKLVGVLIIDVLIFFLGLVLLSFFTIFLP